MKCPVCQQNDEIKFIYEIKRSPAIINVVYDSKESSVNAKNGKVQLQYCTCCGFCFNGAFDRNIVDYNESYDNSKNESNTYIKYLKELVGIISSHISSSQHILEIGCGDGKFLKMLAARTKAKCEGYDNALKTKSTKHVSFYKSYFRPKQTTELFDVVILRHVLEHIYNPYDYIKEVVDNCLLSNGDIWIEVPDFDWTRNNNCFYDISHEHCNYFSKRSLVRMFMSIGLEISYINNVFSGQYILVKASKEDAVSFKFLERKAYFEKLIKKSINSCVWGVSGKGVAFLNALSKDSLNRVKYVIDINPKKQNKFLPCCAKKVDPPEILKNQEVTVFVMNRIYSVEIEKQLKQLNTKYVMYCL